MKIKVAAAAPEILPGQPGQNMANVLAAIDRARADGAQLWCCRRACRRT